MALVRRVGAFLRRDFREEWSYPWVLLNELITVVGGLALLYFLSQLVEGGSSPHLAALGQDYFLFALFGVMTMDFLWVTLRGFNQRIRYYQLTGTLEACLMTRTPLWQVVLCAPAYSLVKAGARSAVYLVAALAVLGSSVAGRGLPLAAAGVALAMVVFVALGMTSAAITLVIKRGDPLAYLVNGASLLVGGVLYPVEVLPDWLRPLSQLVPVAPVLEIIRGALQAGLGASELGPHFAHLGLFAVVTVPLAILTFAWADRRVRRDGSLSHY